MSVQPGGPGAQGQVARLKVLSFCQLPGVAFSLPVRTSSQSQIPSLASEIDSISDPHPCLATRRKRLKDARWFKFKIREEIRLKWPHLPPRPKSPGRTASISGEGKLAVATPVVTFLLFVTAVNIRLLFQRSVLKHSSLSSIPQSHLGPRRSFLLCPMRFPDNVLAINIV